MFFEFFTPVKTSENLVFAPTQIGSSITLFDGREIDLTEYHLAIIGVPDDRGSFTNHGNASAPDAVRHEFYKLHVPFADKELKILDLGNIQPGNELKDTVFALASSVLHLMTHKVLPIIIGGGHDLTFGQYLGYQELYKLVNMVVIDERIDMQESDGNCQNSSSFLSCILTHNPNYLFNLSLVGFQTYLCNPFLVEMLDSLNYDCIRLGKARQKMEDLEPIMRDSDLISIDMSSLKMADSKALQNPTPNGFTGEELCLIARYAGMSDKLTSFGIYEMNPLYDNSGQSTQLTAQIIWCFIEGFYNRKGDHPKNETDFLKFIVKLDELDHELIFWKSKTTDRWWMELPFGDREKYERHQMVPCSYQDYEMACKEEIPDRWMKVYNKLLEN
jgi:formiminoglutamase